MPKEGNTRMHGARSAWYTPENCVQYKRGKITVRAYTWYARNTCRKTCEKHAEKHAALIPECMEQFLDENVDHTKK